MNILWITNMMLPPLSKRLGLPIRPVGGWMYSSLKRMYDVNPKNKFGVATVWTRDEFKKLTIDNITYFLLPLRGKCQSKYNSHLEKYWKEIKSEFLPEIVHIHGSEYPHGLAYVNACGNDGIVVSLQGMVSIIGRYYLGSLRQKDILYNYSIRDLLKRDSLNRQKKQYIKRGEFEIKLLKKVKYVIGRTEWDKTHSLSINPNLSYRYCGETLRDSFYNHKWQYENCKPNTIFVTNAGAPFKGFHMILLAMPLILREFPNTTIRVCATNLLNIPSYKLTTYQKYLKNLITRLELNNHITFLGSLSEKEICDEFLKCNVYICASSIENSPNSLGEAQMLGVPHIASFCGGIPEIVNYNSEILYRFEEFEMLATKVCHIFQERKAFIPKEFDRKRYDGNYNSKLLNEIYQQIGN